MQQLTSKIHAYILTYLFMLFTIILRHIKLNFCYYQYYNFLYYNSSYYYYYYYYYYYLLLLQLLLLFSFRIHSKNRKIKLYKTVILSILFYGCEGLSQTLREERRLGVFKNRILRQIFGPQREENGEWRIVCTIHLIQSG